MLGSSNRRPRGGRHARSARGFTLVELMVTVLVLAIIAVALGAVLYTASRSKTATSNQVESVQAARSALEMIAGDLRSSGYDVDMNHPSPQPPIAYVDSTELILNANLLPYPDTEAPRTPPLAYDPGGNPKPATLSGTAWTPVAKYRTGAEIVRYTLDVNNDGVVDANDVTGTLADATKNPNDYVLMRQVFGDSVGNVAGNNGPVTNDAVALVSRPGGAVPPLFSVYLRGSTTPWNWASGPVPVTELPNIERIVVRVEAPSSKPDAKGDYARTELSTDVNTSRSVPNWGVPTYPVTGFVYDDLNKNRTRDVGEPGIPGVSVRLGNSYTGLTGAAGDFIIRAPAGNYTLRHTPLPNYGAFDSPDSFVLTIGPATSRSFADTARAGGWASVLAFDDSNSNGSHDAGEPGVPTVLITPTPGSNPTYTDGSGLATLFIQEGGYSLAATPPDSFIVTSTNPQIGAMANMGSASHTFALSKSATGTVKGKVFRDNNRNGLFDAGEPGMQNVWVGVTSDNGVTVQGYTNTDASGDYSIDVPINDPPRTTPYSIFYVVPAGFFPTNGTSINPIWVQAAQILLNNDFGLATYQIITLNASRVLSLASGDLIEKDWNGNQTQNARKDADIVLGADAGGTDNISVWFNDYDSTPLFQAAPTYTRNAAQSVLALALDTLENNPANVRPDVVTGTRNATAGNFFVWFNQNTSGNLGYVPTTPSLSYRTADAGDVQAVLTLDCASGVAPDIIVGTKSPTAGRGTFEVWVNNDAATPTFARDESYPPYGSIPGNLMGEVTSMALGDLDNDGRQDLIVGTRISSWTGELLIFRNVSRVNGARFQNKQVYTISTGAVTSVACLDVNGDGFRDIVVGTQTGASSGTLQQWHNLNLSSMGFAMVREVPAPGIVMSLAKADLGGSPREDVAMGWRQSESDYAGGVRIYYTDLGLLPATGVDPSAGSVYNMVPSITTNNFNYGVQPTTPAPPYLSDIGVGVKITATTGALVVFIR